jgi:hypothetical protein
MIGVVALALGGGAVTVTIGIATVTLGAVLSGLGIRVFKVRLVVSPRDFADYGLLAVRRVDVDTVAAVDMVHHVYENFEGGSSGGWSLYVRLKDGGEMVVRVLGLGNRKGRPTDEGLQLLEELRQVLHVGGETLGPAEPLRRDKRRSDG